MEFETLSNQLKHFSGPYPKAALEKAIQSRDSIVPGLLNAIRQTIDNSLDVIDRDDNALCTYAMYLLAQFREKQAYPLIIELLSLPEGKPLEIAGDMFIEDIGRILASVACGDTSLLKKLIENREASELIRASAIEALLVMVHEKELDRAEAIAYFKHLFQRGLEKEPSVVWDCLVSGSIDLHPGDLYDEIDDAYDQDLVNENNIDQDKLFEAMDMEEKKVMETFFQGTFYTFITDVIKEMEELTAISDDEETIEFD